MNKEIKEYARGLDAREEVIEWIEKRVTGKEEIGELEHIVDYLISDESPKRLDRATYKQMKESTDKWNKRLIEKAKDIQEEDGDVEVVLDFKDGFKVVKLVGENAYKERGNLMRHCVASYYGNNKEVYSLRDSKNNPHCTIEKDQQIKGKGNGDIHPKYIDYVVKFLEYTGMKVRDSEMDHLGYKVVEFPDYCLNKLYRDKYIRKTEEIKYDTNRCIIFTDLNEAVKYTGDKGCLLSGNAYFEFSNITDLGKLENISGNADFRDSKITSLGNLKNISGDAYFVNSNITDLGNLENIGGYAYFRYSKITDLGKLENIGGDADFKGSKITDLVKLENIGGNADFKDSNITSLGNLENIGGNAYFKGSNITDLGNLENIGGNAYFEGSIITDLGNLENIGGNAYFKGSNITDLGNLENIGGYAYFEYSDVTDLGNLKNIGGDAYFRDSKITSLGKLENIGGHAYFSGSKIKEEDRKRFHE